MTVHPRCDECPLNAQGSIRVQCEQPAGQCRAAIVGETPGFNEELLERPFVGESGRWLDATLKQFGAQRSQFLVTNALLCKPKAKLRDKEWEKALACCKPRLDAELAAAKAPGIIALGGRAMQAVCGYRGIHSWAGEVIPTNFGPMVPSYHPSAVLRKPALKSAAMNFIRRGLLVADGKYVPAKFSLLYSGTEWQMHAAVLEQMLITDDPIGVDVETGGTDPYSAPLLCVGLANTVRGCSIPFPMPECIHALVQRCLSGLRCYYHNGQHDILTLQNNGFKDINYTGDTMFGAATYNAQAPKDLGFVAACATDLPRWKSRFRQLGGFNKATLDQLKEYNAQDAQGTVKLSEKQDRLIAHTYNGWELYKHTLALGRVMMRARDRGLLIDNAARERHTVDQTSIAEQCRVSFAVAMEDFGLANLGKYTMGQSGTTHCLKELFFQKFGLTPLKHSEETGEPCLNAYTLEQYKACDHAEARKVAGIVLAYRKAGKLLSTYLDGLPISPDGRVHSSFRVDGTVTGRQSSSDPNVQNWPKPMRDMVIPAPGNVFVAADLTAAEQYMMAILAGAQRLLGWLRAGEDVHQKNAEILGVTRGQAKTPGYAVAYGAGVETVWAQLKSKGASVSLKFVQELFNKYHNLHPEIGAYQHRLIREAVENGYVEETLSGRRERFYDGVVEPTQVVNFPIQGGVATIINRATLKVAEQIDWKTWFLVAQVHDELMLEVPEADALKAAKLLKSCMEQKITIGDESITIPADAKVGKDWYNMEKIDA